MREESFLEHALACNCHYFCCPLMITQQLPAIFRTKSGSNLPSCHSRPLRFLFLLRCLNLRLMLFAALTQQTKVQMGWQAINNERWVVVVLSLYSLWVCLKQNSDETSVIPQLTVPTNTYCSELGFYSAGGNKT